MDLAGVVLSNHGGRQLDFARSGIEVLVEVVDKLKGKRGLSFPNEKFQLFIDGGVRRATDVIKAVALGATAGIMTPPFAYLLLTRCDSRRRPSIPVCIFLVRTRGSRKGFTNLACMAHTFPWFRR